MSTETSNLKNNISSFNDDDEIDLVELFKTLWKNKKIIITTALLFAITAGIISFMLPKQYKSTASFFITESDKPSSSLMGYAAMLGVNTPSNIESLLQNVLNSYSIKIKIAEQFENEFKKSINNYIQKNPNKSSREHILDYIIKKKLILHKNFNFSINKNSLFKLSYTSHKKDLSKNILDTYLKQIIAYNESLKLSAEKDVITIIDSPNLPLKKDSPRNAINILLGLTFGLFSSSIFIIIKLQINKR